MPNLSNKCEIKEEGGQTFFITSKLQGGGTKSGKTISEAPCLLDT